jgi:hypothetical protein
MVQVAHVKSGNMKKNIKFRTEEEQEEIVQRALKMTTQPVSPEVDPTDGEIIAIEICSSVLEDHIWLAFDRSFDPKDGKAIYYPEELPFLATKDMETLREIHKVKLAFGPGSWVRK